ncbi:MAG: (2S)-methylsuccinyl-CoA dehydrogenase [Actinomycetota bacterium]|jgi:(2S)-methylsuccinyl-CoA dehydrogenase|nr:(2S)-methylsuccinyl-CoA dehydrogenase [Actinomycetota bacterium]
MSTDQELAAGAALDLAASVVDTAVSNLAQSSLADGKLSVAKLDENQVIAYDLAHAAAAVEAGRVMKRYAEHGETESMLARAFVADAVSDIVARLIGREELWGVDPATLAPAHDFVAAHRAPVFLEALADQCAKHGTGPTHLGSDFELVGDTFRRFADDKIRPVAEHVHRTNADVPEEVISGLAEIGGFGLSVPEEYDGFATGGESDYIGMVVATEELSRGSLGIGGSLVTRPEILTRALVAGGTEDQKRAWLPRIASGEVMVGIMVTEPDYGSDVAGVKVAATPTDGGWLVNGVKTWATFAGRADVLMLLARTDPDKSKSHRGLSVMIVEKPRAEGHSFAFEDGRGGKMEGRAIDTIGYRGMHSYEVAFDNWFVPADNLIGGESGLGRGFYFQMAGFENGRLQTAARAVGLMQAAFEAGMAYAQDRKVFGSPVFEYQLSKAKLARMAFLIQAGRQFSYDVARKMAAGEGTLEASMVKAYVCRAAEWVTREAMQLHGGMGYAEEFPVSRFFVDARVLSIFEGADETLCLRVIARRLAENALARS